MSLSSDADLPAAVLHVLPPPRMLGSDWRLPCLPSCHSWTDLDCFAVPLQPFHPNGDRIVFMSFQT